MGCYFCNPYDPEHRAHLLDAGWLWMVCERHRALADTPVVDWTQGWRASWKRGVWA